MKILLATTLTLGMLGLSGCTPSEPATAPPAAELPAGSMTAPAATDIPMTALPEFTAGPYQVLPKYEESLADGHINLYVTGGPVEAVRIWVGEEDPAGALVVKSEIENDYYHGHLEMPNPIPESARLWAEIESPDGTTVKGSTPLQ